MKPLPLNENYLVSEDGKVYSNISNRYLNCSLDHYGYKVFQVKIDGRYRQVKLHRAVGMCYLPNPNNLPFINHKDGDKLNNHVDNLEWCDDSHNKRHAHSLGLHAHGQRHGNSRLTERQVHGICEMFSNGFTTGDVVQVYGVSRGTALNIRGRRTWRHVSDNYEWDYLASRRNNRKSAETISQESTPKQVEAASPVRDDIVRTHRKL